MGKFAHLILNVKILTFVGHH